MRRRKPNQGVVLLVVLSLLTLLVVVGITFLLSSGQYKRAAETQFRDELQDDPPELLLERAMGQVVYDTTNVNSVARQHGLLTDMYGYDTAVQSQVTAFPAMPPAAPFAPGPVPPDFLQFEVSPALSNPPESLRHHYYSGCVLTFLNGNLRHFSTRIIDYTVDLPNNRTLITIVRPKPMGTVNIVPSVGDQFLINGRPFNGTGAGYLSGTLTQSLAGVPIALLPNRANDAGNDGLYHGNAFGGGLNEGYDAVDFQNMALAAIIPPQTGANPDPANDPEERNVSVVPSYHRPALINYWRNQAMLWSQDDLKRRVILRPMPFDHPNFTGSNPAFDISANYIQAAIDGPWDVDNDGDGIPDSVWIDLGFPAQRDKTGRLYKPLFAILCVDADGKLSVNGHGSLAQIPGNATQPQPTAVALAYSNGTPPWGWNSNELASGQGYGPAEISLFPLLASSAEYLALLQGNAAQQLTGRYGFDLLPGYNTMDPLAQFKFFDFPNPPNLSNYFLVATPLHSYFSPPDLRGELVFGLDWRGSSYYERPSGNDVLSNSPYEINLSQDGPRGMTGTASDDLYSVAELERLLRAYDVDASQLPDRLWRVIDSLRLSRRNRNAVTTDSYDLPSPNLLPVLDPSLAAGNPPKHIVDLLVQRLNQERILSMQPPMTPLEANNAILQLLPQFSDLSAGMRFDVNRLFGNGRDDAPTNGLVDETTETGGYVNRYNYMKQLYVLMMMFKDRAYTGLDYDGNVMNGSRRETHLALAQWCANVVDFRDADSIMTGFEIDINPFVDDDGNPANGTWDVDGNFATNENGMLPPAARFRRIVWGTERPELLISEALAFHDTRTEDTNIGGMYPMDNDLDQRLMPRGSLFVELHNPWAGDERPSVEFGLNGVLLNQRSAIGQNAVWRIIVDDDPAANPDDQDNPLVAERSIYFARQSAIPTDPNQGQPYFFDDAMRPPAPILPGRYALVGPRGQTQDDLGQPLDINGNGRPDYLTTTGRHTMASEGGFLMYDQTQHILLEPDANPATDQVTRFPNPGVSKQPSVAIVVDRTLDPMSMPVNRQLSVSEPVNGYPEYTLMSPGPGGEVWMPDQADYEGAYQPALDTPLDNFNQNEYQSYSVVHLQRLANPLLPFDPVSNPYLTIDSMDVDLLVFNGVESNLPAALPPGNPQKLYARQRGDNNSTISRNLWRHEPGGIAYPNSPVIANHIFDRQLVSSVGYLNTQFGPAFDMATAAALPAPNPTRFVGAPNSVAPDSQSSPPFPWFNWQNRPFVSHFEIMQVPRSSSYRMLRDYELRPGAPAYGAPSDMGTFGHLLNFHEGDPAGTPGNFYRVLEYLHVPTRFMDAETILAANPYTAVPHYREPAKININTVFDPRVWSGLLGVREARAPTTIPQVRHTGPTYSTLVNTRRGYAPGPLPPSNPDWLIQLNPQIPTFFANPFRPPGSADMVPLPNMRRDDVDTTWLRTDQDSRPPSLSGESPLLQSTRVEAYRNAARNSHFRYQPLTRLGNLVTTRSNVYAIWVTVGYFEVTAGQIDTGHPDGYRLGREIGSLSGEVKRHRGFYIIDRSIPVAVQPGENHNVDRAILLRRFIE